ncbi:MULTISPECIES: TIGR03619 family F420-dependent LLM class oxidoreductase [Prauserella salsuginis group]|uniref:TIGR03619 family F420-dependent LLM class oxidoreductase n=2 Tax=Prauserella salsuginis group TaxID=2893672 RepID=A0ABW6G843_9PSEU|nr:MULTISPECIES: TIGR03619 family F420-dependent LLM class oxidoreductase [Prauserella salsuginis group]MBB3664304.1 putative F420-dependent oxidoreductase [Prauserella sediminis]MCR3721748.1 putative F420-dependent oxidoreductase, Rv2161c family [Prauserella flava]MCR3734439.1 putative F420-dependent oxidoreductase, Rv2161c family [Prauserella salsuginis]
MRFTLSVALTPLDQLTELAVTAEECGFSSIALPDSLFYSEQVSADYPYTPDGSRFWDENTPWVDPLIAAASMGAATDRITFYTSVLKLGSRNPVLLARQVGSVANLTGDRFGLGLGVGWAPEEFEWCGVPYRRRGKRVDEAIDVLRLILGGGMVEYHGEFFDFDKLCMSPAPKRHVPFYIGGHSEPALRRAARVGDGWSSAMMKLDDLRDTIARLNTLRAEYGRADEPFEFQAVCIDRFGLDGYREQADVGVTDVITVPWVFDGLGFDAPVEQKKDSIKKFADEIIERF